MFLNRQTLPRHPWSVVLHVLGNGHGRHIVDKRLRDIMHNEEHDTATAKARSRHTPPIPPLQPTPVMACDPETPYETLWLIARQYPHLRRWIVANPSADAELLEYISQQGGPLVREALEVLLESLEAERRS